ncbi:glycine-rich protein 1-like isoform X2 [Hyla sarda]|uniref:glycine-rich protein 1-like isoform X2 n=1 Tax=Hyla sarda TaxID=327740 RepID=UPI0024C25D4E|nr:glycine-rich protein 1-like isoform X2 [Hyla sarda]
MRLPLPGAPALRVGVGLGGSSRRQCGSEDGGDRHAAAAVPAPRRELVSAARPSSKGSREGRALRIPAAHASAAPAPRQSAGRRRSSGLYERQARELNDAGDPGAGGLEMVAGWKILCTGGGGDASPAPSDVSGSDEMLLDDGGALPLPAVASVADPGARDVTAAAAGVAGCSAAGLSASAGASTVGTAAAPPSRLLDASSAGSAAAGGLRLVPAVPATSQARDVRNRPSAGATAAGSVAASGCGCCFLKEAGVQPDEAPSGVIRSVASV